MNLTVYFIVAGVIFLAILIYILRDLWFDIEDWVEGFRHCICKRYVRAIASLISPYISALQQKAQKAGEKVGYQRGYSEGKKIWEVSDSRTIPAERDIDDSVYGPELFKVTDALCDRMRREVQAAVNLKLVSPPTSDQWRMILSNHPSTCVLAGAGSGKSTTLVLRIIFMMAHLKIRPEDMTVVSFTNDSCDDLRGKLIDLAPHWALPINNSVVKNIVRTFHSALFRMGKEVFPGVIWFENIGREINVEDNIDHPFSSNIEEAQVELLKPAYVDLFKNDSIFRRAVLAMLQIECSRDTIPPPPSGSNSDKDWVVKVASRRDRSLVDLLNARWREHGLWPIENIDPTPFEAFRVGGHPFYANGKIASSGTPVFLGAGTQEDGWFADDETVGNGDARFAVKGSIGVKRNIVSWRCGKTSVYLGSKGAIDSLVLQTKYLSAQCSPDEAPMFEVRLGGEKGRVPLLEAFISQASFIESMGFEVTDFVRRMRAFRDADIDHHFCTALARYWPYLEQELWKKGIMTFNRGFRKLGDALTDPQEWPALAPYCSPLTHLLIDEFQDISSQIVSWIKNAQRLLAVKNRKPSIMAIGDDWQSIYGWRGSSPEFFIHFDRYFKVHSELTKSNLCPMGENFRSIPEIVEDGTEILRPVTIKTRKLACSSVPKNPDDHGVKLVLQGSKSDDKYQQEIVEVIDQQYTQMIERSGGDKRKVLVIGRTNNSVNALKKRIGTKRGLSYRTIHRSKGLQAEVAVIYEDCTTEGQHAIRDRVYALIDGFQCKSYEDAQRDEALRLAYVAVTRGIRRVYWFAGKGDGAAKTLWSRAS